MKKSITTILLLCSFIPAFADTKWELKKDKDGIKVYTGNIPNSNIKAIKVDCILNGNLEQLTALLLDAKAHERWVYSTTTSYVVKQVSDQHQIYYSEMSMPWPIVNRDVVVDLKITQDPATKVVTVSSVALQGHVPAKKDKIRVPMSKVTWTVTPVGNNKLKVEYVAQADPGGSVPVWAVNMFSTKGPFETFKKLNETLAAGAYKNADVSFVTN